MAFRDSGFHSLQLCMNGLEREGRIDSGIGALPDAVELGFDAVTG